VKSLMEQKWASIPYAWASPTGAMLSTRN
jgi:hypothetical protein